MLACSRPELEVVGVTAVWGNHAVEHTADNSLRTLDVIGRSDVPVHAGCDGPITPRPDLPPAKGSPEPDVLPAPASSRAPAPEGGVEWLVETARAATQQLTLVATGSLSNVASALRADPSLVDAIDEIVVMGGSIDRGGQLPAVETNVRNDPEAAHVVIEAGFGRLVLVPLDATYCASVTSEQCTTLRREGGVAAGLAADYIEQRIERYRHLPAMAGRAAAPVHDALTIAYLLDPTLVTLRAARVRVESDDAATRGRTYVELDPAGDVMVAVDADPERFFELLLSSLRTLP